jgi:thioredoxin-related protein/tetratricopeptide (TPR) repeat protein
VSAILVLLSVASSFASAESPPWIRDLEAGKKAALESGKDLMIVFTGHGWCLSCDILDKEIFQQPLFIEYAAKTHVFVELDLVFGETPEMKAREAQYRKLQEQYLIRGVPTVVLADADGRPYAIMTGHTRGDGPVTGLAMMQLALLAKKRRDQEFSAADQVVGVERARLLSRGIQSVGWLLGSIAERGNDPALVFYRPQITEITRLDSTASGEVRAPYDARRSQRDDWIARESVFDKLTPFNETRDYRGALELIGTTIPKVKDRETLARLERSRQTYLEWDKQYEAALKNIQRLLATLDLRPNELEWALDREAFNLFNLERIDEGLSHYDRRIAEARNNPEKRRRLLWWKAQLILNRGRGEQAIAAWRDFRDAEPRETRRWQTATSLLARELRKADKHQEALELVNQVLEIDKSKEPNLEIAWSMIDAAESLVALGQREKAGDMIHRASTVSTQFKDSERESEKDLAFRLQKRIETLRQQIAARP